MFHLHQWVEFRLLQVVFLLPQVKFLPHQARFHHLPWWTWTTTFHQLKKSDLPQ
jgi:hypothetical protein